MGALLALPLAAASAAYVPIALAMSAACCCCQGISCACSTANLLSCCCRNSLGRKSGLSPRVTKIFYILIFGIAAIVALILRFNSSEFDLGALTVNCSSGTSNVEAYGLSQGTYVYCKGDAAVFRISFVLTLFFSCMLVLSLFSEGLHRGYWFFKIFIIVGAIVGSFFIPNDVFDNGGYAWVARIGSVFFLILQILILIDFAYQWNEDWVERAYAGSATENDPPSNPNWLTAVLTCAALLYASSIVGVALLYAYYSDCGVGIAFTTITVLMVLFVTVLSLFRDKIVGVPGAVLPSAVMSAYAVFLAWSALESNPDATCRPGTQTALTIVLGAVWALLTLCWTTFSVTTNASHLVQGEELEKPPEMDKLKDSTSRDIELGGGGPVTREAEANQIVVEDDENDEPVYSKEKAWVFHLVMIFASMYLAMLLSDWGTLSGGGGGNNPVTAGTASMWVKIVAEWVTLLLFAWTLIAPAVLKRRDFS